MKLDKSVSISNILRNNFNNITTTYNLLLQKKIRNGKNVSDFVSDIYRNYINDKRNKLLFLWWYRINHKKCNKWKQKRNNIKVVLPIIINLMYTIINFYFEKQLKKLRDKSDEYINRQITDRQKDKNILLNFPIKFHTIEHDSYSNSKKKKENIKSKNKSPNLTQFHSKKNNHNIHHNINTIKINGYTLNKYKENPPSIHHYAETKKSNGLYLNLLNKKA